MKRSMAWLNSACGGLLRLAINIPDLASEIAESLADLIVTGVPPEEQPHLIAHVVDELARLVAEKRGAHLQ
jgi:hypothetical protein